MNITTPIHGMRSSADRRTRFSYPYQADDYFNAKGQRDPTRMKQRHILEMLPYFFWEDRGAVPPAIVELANKLFRWILPYLKPSKLPQKAIYFQQLLHALSITAWADRVLAYSREESTQTACFIQVIDASVRAGLTHNERSLRLSSTMSRLLPTIELLDLLPTDPVCLQPSRPTEFVILRSRVDKTPIPFDPTATIPAAVQCKLSLINAVNANHDITYVPWNPWERRHWGQSRIRPTLRAIFTDDFQHHGRLYTDRFGHQGLRQTERDHLYFDDDPAVELDFQALHARLAYNLEGRDYSGDPYALWTNTKPAMRLLSKLVINTCLNANSRPQAMAAIRQKVRSKTTMGKLKTGKLSETAFAYRQALSETGLKLEEIYDLAWKIHEPIQKYFHADTGLKLMNWDSRIALDITYHFACQAIPCLPVHDSFLVPCYLAEELAHVMREVYHRHIGFYPVVKLS